MKNNNKGAAMITVLIAVMFIGLLATSLIYMAYNNYITKSMRWSSTDNFYYDEFALDDLTCEMQQFCAKQSSIDDAITSLETTCGVTTEEGVKVYNPTALAQFIGIANSNPDVLQVTLSRSSLPGRELPLYEKSAYTLTFKNLKITTYDKKRGYTTSITVDFTISIKNNDQGSMKVNDFSLMSDNPIVWERGGNLVYGGNVFCMNKENINGTAFTVNNASNCTFSGDRTLIVGNMKISGFSVVCMSGQVTVTGDIEVEAGSALFCTSNLTIGGQIKGGGKVYGNKDFDPDMCATIEANCTNLFGPGGQYAGGLASIILDDVMVIYNFSDHGDGTCSYSTITYNATTAGEGYSQDSMGALARLSGSNDYKSAAQSSEATSGTKGYIRNGSDNTNAEPNTLLFFTHNGQKLRQASENTTVIAPAGVSLGSDDATVGPSLDHMCDKDYDAILNSMMGKNASGNMWAPGGIGVSTSAAVDITGFNSIISSHATGLAAGEEAFVDGYVIIPYQSLSGTMKYAVYSKTNGMYIPWKYFIRDDANTLITGAFEGVVGNDNALYSSVSYSNWVKE